MTGESKIEEIERRLRELAEQLNETIDDDRASELVQEAAKLAAQAGEEVTRALSEATPPEAEKG